MTSAPSRAKVAAMFAIVEALVGALLWSSSWASATSPACSPSTSATSMPSAPTRPHGHGKRRIDYGRREPNECDKPDANAVTCPKVRFGAFGMSVLSAARAKLGQNNADSLGLGACTRLSAPSAQLDQWNMSIHVHDFRHADEALRIIDAELHHWDIGDDWGLSISGITCSSLL